jgi:Tol biopolymer transport system component
MQPNLTVRQRVTAILDPTDLTMIAAIATLIVAIVVVALFGDQIGLDVTDYGPVDTGAMTPLIRLTTADPIVAASVAARFSITPSVAGRLMVDGTQLTFVPSAALPAGEVVTVTLKAGLESSTGSRLKHDLSWRFTVRQPRIAYLAPLDGAVQNLYIMAAGESSGTKVTDSKYGIRDLVSAPDGETMVYAQLDESADDNGTPSGDASLYQYDLRTKTNGLLYRCQSAICSGATFRPDGAMLAFERVEVMKNANGDRVPGVSRVWLLDMRTGSARPLLSDNQQLGYSPRWSPDGSMIALYNGSIPGVVIYNFKTLKTTVIPSVQGEVGTFSLDGKWLYFPRIVDQTGGFTATHLMLVDVTSPAFVQTDLLADDDPTQDREAVWSADSKRLIVARTNGINVGLNAPQLYSVDVQTGEAVPLNIDNDHNNSESNLTLSPDGKVLLFQRFPLDKPGAQPQLWLYDLDSHAARQIAENTLYARWLP